MSTALQEALGDRARCLVTGGCGFIGRHVADELAALGASVTTLDKCAFNAIRAGLDRHVVGDVRDTQLLSDVCEQMDFVFHLSGVLGTHELFVNPKEAVDVNINGALSVLTAVEKCRSRPRVFLPAKPNEWNNIYSVTSQAVEKFGHTYRDVYGLDIRVLRIRNVYGPGQALYPVRKFVPYCISRALNHETIEIFGDGTQDVELLYVRDVARLVTRYMFFEGDVRQTHEIRPVSSIPVQSLAEQIVALACSRSRLVQVPMRLGEQPGTKFSSAPQINALFDDKRPFVSVLEGLRLTLDWYRQLPLAVRARARTFYEAS